MKVFNYSELHFSEGTSFKIHTLVGSIFNVGDGFFGPTKGTRGLQHHKFLIFDGKQHPKNIWFRGC